MYATHTAIKENATIYLLHIVDIRVYDYDLPIYDELFFESPKNVSAGKNRQHKINEPNLNQIN